ncbi:MAG: aminoacyltransferase [Candidatus Obscuribacterales bacterium]|jgi:lipid II:glycine glycyltransferase (peptidoglycan interpeptide bridge formation enzyme)|nr:aminoacyltransferase [Candidatus Obscuribacterales bacterium]
MQSLSSSEKEICANASSDKSGHWHPCFDKADDPLNLIVQQLSPDCLDAETVQSWEDLVSRNPASGFMQRLSWARFKSKMGQIARIILVKQNDEIVAGTLVYAGYDPKKPSIMVAPYGPVLPWQDAQLARACLRLILEAAEKIAAELNIVSLRIEPRIEHPVPRLLSEFGAGPCNLVPAETLLLDLTPEPAAILAQMKAKCRYNISLSQRKGVQVRELQLDALHDPNEKPPLDILYSMLEEASDRDDFYLEPRSFFETLLAELGNSEDQILRLFIAEHDGCLLGALLLVTEGQRATYLYGGISNLKRNLMPGYALQWKAMTEAKAAGCTSYDFYGFDQFAVPGHAYARFSRFKRGFGGRAMRFIGAQDYVFMDRLVDNVVMFFKDLPESSCMKNLDNDQDL